MSPTLPPTGISYHSVHSTVWFSLLSLRMNQVSLYLSTAVSAHLLLESVAVRLLIFQGLPRLTCRLMWSKRSGQSGLGYRKTQRAASSTAKTRGNSGIVMSSSDSSDLMVPKYASVARPEISSAPLTGTVMAVSMFPLHLVICKAKTRTYFPSWVRYHLGSSSA